MARDQLTEYLNSFLGAVIFSSFHLNAIYLRQYSLQKDQSFVTQFLTVPENLNHQPPRALQKR